MTFFPNYDLEHMAVRYHGVFVHTVFKKEFSDYDSDCILACFPLMMALLLWLPGTEHLHS